MSMNQAYVPVCARSARYLIRIRVQHYPTVDCTRDRQTNLQTRACLHTFFSTALSRRPVRLPSLTTPDVRHARDDCDDDQSPSREPAPPHSLLRRAANVLIRNDLRVRGLE